MDEVPLDRRASAVSSGIPLAAWLLLGVAAITLGVHAAMDWYQLFGPYLILRPEKVMQALSSAAPFLLAAAVLAGAVRWPMGRRWLGLAAGALALSGALELGFLAWFAWWESSGEPISGPMQVGLFARSAILALASLAAPLLLAMGLRTARHHAPSPDRARRAWMLFLGIIGMVATGGGVAIAALGFVQSPDWTSAALWVTYGSLQALGVAATALLALAALRSMPSGGLPEPLIAAGATIGVAASGWIWWFQFFTPLPEQASMSWAFVVPRAVGVAGVLVMVGGFAAGRLFGEPGRTG